MTDEIYEQLAAALDRLPNGFPRTPGNTEIAILKKILDPEEAALAGQLGGAMEPVDQIAARLGRPAGETRDRLMALLRRGVVRFDPTVLFGPGCILLNNIAWFLRRFPVFAIPGDGRYRLQPTHIEDLAELAVQAGHREDNIVLDAVGPETYAYGELVRLIARTIGSKALIVHVPPGLALVLARILGLLVRDVVLTREEIAGLMAELLLSAGPPTGQTRLSQWLAESASALGREYFSEVGRHYR